ncbi:Retrovirus-related Pol polyprotein from transposon RE1 [Vitis vinifera]|uniref:Retrovirus-related Pol polyprotein from transposon RE1 n=1 Tax=Vitis vinifera TaxID=29760 RepID=A0A438HPK1_VITVI|nr:Retrovirus-related Pol polyprotein from transposon RE1 [Vitis vinifera]
MGQAPTLEDVFTEIPNQSSFVEGVLNLEPDPFMKRLPHYHNRECPPGKKPVGCRWIYTVKYKADGSIERFKARLVAKWYTQTYGIDYTETFAPVAKINTIRVLLSLAANPDWPLQQFDVKNVFLHGELSKKQFPRAWFGRFTKSMRAFGYRQITGNDPEERKALQNYLSREFEMKDLGPLKYFLGIEVSRSSEGIFLSQRKYALDLLQEIGMSGCQPIDTPIEEGLKLLGVEPKNGSTGSTGRGTGRPIVLVRSSTGRGGQNVSLSPSGLLFPVKVILFPIEVRSRTGRGPVEAQRSRAKHLMLTASQPVDP